jgi:hypothetical protein
MAGRVAYIGGIITNGLILNLDAAKEDSYPKQGANWNDISGNRNSGVLNGTVVYNNSDKSIAFGANVGDYITLPNGLLYGVSDFTINQWIKSDGDTTLDQYTTFTNYPAGNLQVLYGKYFIGLYLGNNEAYLGAAPWNTLLTEFNTRANMITVLRFGTTTQVYLNGLLVKTGTSNATIGTQSSAFRIGANTDGGERYKGKIYSTQVYNRALSAAEILQNYNTLKGRYGLAIFPANLLASLVSRWKLDGNSLDSVGTNNGTNTSITYVPGTNFEGKAAEFDGANSYINVADNTSLNFGTGDFTVSAWVYPYVVNYALDKAGTIITKDFTAYEFSVYEGQIAAYIGGSGILAGSVSINNWYHVVLLRISGVVKMYINAIEVHSSTITTSASSGYDFQIGIRGTNPTNSKMNGRIDDVCVWKNRGLNEEEVSQLYKYYNS